MLSQENWSQAWPVYTKGKFYNIESLAKTRFQTSFIEQDFPFLHGITSLFKETSTIYKYTPGKSVLRGYKTETNF